MANKHSIDWYRGALINEQHAHSRTRSKQRRRNNQTDYWLNDAQDALSLCEQNKWIEIALDRIRYARRELKEDV